MPSTPFHTNVSLSGFHFEDSMFTMNLASGITAADIGKAVSVDASGPNKAKLAGDGDFIIGRLEVVENRVQEGQLVGTVARRFSNPLPIKSGSGVAVGQSVVGAGAGEVKPAGTTDHARNIVFEVRGAFAIVQKI